MKPLLLLLSLLVSTTLVAQETSSPPPLVNTLKERITLSGYAQAGFSTDNADGGHAEFDIKRIIFMAEGKITDRWKCYFMYDLGPGNQLLELYVEYRFLPWLSARVGEFKTMYTIENPMSPCNVELINCYAQGVSYLAGVNGSDPLYGATSGRDLGLLVYGTLPGGWADYNLAMMNGQGVNTKDRNRAKDLVGSLTIHPLKWLSLNGSFIRGEGCAVATSAYNPDIAVGENYRRNRWSAGILVKTRPVTVRAEYLEGTDGTVKSRGGYLSTTVRLFKELDAVASIDYFDKNRQWSDASQTNSTIGLQYHFYPRCRLQAQYTHRNPREGAGSHLFQTQLQIRF
ncbi:MAG: OprO/OprP family phosphate-selective porin [Prevotellaceae bacterium]|jgi:hypothetical protein|nr:OprO/OprP family phosphate-selective porin [Prevotellaceae bacterium]